MLQWNYYYSQRILSHREAYNIIYIHLKCNYNVVKSGCREPSVCATASEIWKRGITRIWRGVLVCTVYSCVLQAAGYLESVYSAGNQFHRRECLGLLWASNNQNTGREIMWRTHTEKSFVASCQMPSLAVPQARYICTRVLCGADTVCFSSTAPCPISFSHSSVRCALCFI